MLSRTISLIHTSVDEMCTTYSHSNTKGMNQEKLSGMPVVVKGVMSDHEVSKSSILLLISLSHKISYTPITILSSCGNN